MFRKIAEWITGHKRRDDKHPLDYVGAKQEREQQTKNLVWTAGEPAVQVETKTIEQVPIVVPTPAPTVPIHVPMPTPEPKAEANNNAPWPFPISVPEAKVEEVEVKVKKPRKPRQKKTA